MDDDTFLPMQSIYNSLLRWIGVRLLVLLQVSERDHRKTMFPDQASFCSENMHKGLPNKSRINPRAYWLFCILGTQNFYIQYKIRSTSSQPLVLNWKWCRREVQNLWYGKLNNGIWRLYHMPPQCYLQAPWPIDTYLDQRLKCESDVVSAGERTDCEKFQFNSSWIEPTWNKARRSNDDWWK